MSDQPKPATGEWTVETIAVIRGRDGDFGLAAAINAALVAEKRARLFSEHDLIAKFDEQLAAERELVQWCPVHAPTKEEPIVCCPCCEAVHASDKLKATAGIAENVRLYDEVQQLRAQIKELQDEINRLNSR